MAPTRLLAALALSSAACGGDAADVHGSYTIALTNRENGCELSMWTEGAMITGVMVEITQQGDAVSADVQGLAGSALDFRVGGHVYTGSVDGDHLSLSITGTRGDSRGACAFTFDTTLTADLTGDALNGTVRYQAKTNGAADCGTLTGCTSRQDFSGARAPL